jgi:protein-S-isoprenylcysteine O-methyltransferase Ste14
MKSFLLAVRTVVVVSVFVSLWAWIALMVESGGAGGQARLPEWTFVPGLLAMAVGVALTLACVTVFARAGQGTPAPFDPPRRFVAVGPYRYIRNPMYVGGALVLAGWALYRHSPSVLLLTLGWCALFHAFVLVYEEPALRGKFGADYERYLHTVPRWIP